MTGALIGIVALLSVALASLFAVHVAHRRRAPNRTPASECKRILFPFVSDALSQGALDAALRLARAEDATLVPVFLARVALHLPLETPLPRQSAIAIALQEAIEHRAIAFAIRVDARIERGRTYRHALRQTIEHEHFDRMVLAAAANGSAGFHADDIAWLLETAPGEIVVLRPEQDDALQPEAPAELLM